jgi:hypothetical protein
MENIGTRQFIGSKMGQSIAIISNVGGRIILRGKVSLVAEDSFQLNPCCSVEETGPDNGKMPRNEDVLTGPVLLRYEDVRVCWQPNWVNASYGI